MKTLADFVVRREGISPATRSVSTTTGRRARPRAPAAMPAPPHRIQPGAEPGRRRITTPLRGTRPRQSPRAPARRRGTNSCWSLILSTASGGRTRLMAPQGPPKHAPPMTRTGAVKVVLSGHDGDTPQARQLIKILRPIRGFLDIREIASASAIALRRSHGPELAGSHSRA